MYIFRWQSYIYMSNKKDLIFKIGGVVRFYSFFCCCFFKTIFGTIALIIRFLAIPSALTNKCEADCFSCRGTRGPFYSTECVYLYSRMC